MEITKEVKENRKADKFFLQKTISSLKKNFLAYKKERKSEWKTFKTKFNDELREIDHLMKKIKVLHKN